MDKLGMLIDFKLAKAALMEVLAALDHQYLNELEPFRVINPTAENLAQYIYRVLEKHELFQAGSAYLAAIRVWESAHSSVTYSEER